MSHETLPTACTARPAAVLLAVLLAVLFVGIVQASSAAAPVQDYHASVVGREGMARQSFDGSAGFHATNLRTPAEQLE